MSPLLSKTVLLAASFSLVASLPAAEIAKTNDANALDLGTSWVGGVAPGSSDIALFDSTITAQVQPQLGADTSWGGIKVIGPTGTTRINEVTSAGTAAKILTLGASGIDMSAATSNFDIWSRVALSANQSWTIASGRALQVVGWATSNADGKLYDTDLGGFTLTKAGAGTLTIHNGYGLSNGTLVVNEGIVQMNANSNRATGARASATVQVNAGASFSLWNNVPAGFTAEGITYTSADMIQWDGTIRLNGGRFNFSPQNDGAINLRGTIEAATGTTSEIIWGNTSAAAGTPQRDISSALTGGGTLNIRSTTLRLNDRLTLLGDNSAFAGTLIVNSTVASSNRVVRLGAAQSGSAAATWNIAASNTLEVHGVDVAFGGLGDVGTVLNSGTTQSSLTIGALGTNTTFSGVLNGGTAGFRLVKVGAGTLTLSGTNTAITGGIVLRQGGLAFSNVAAFTGGAITIGAAATTAGTLTLNYNANNTAARTVTTNIIVAASDATEVRIGRTATTTTGIFEMIYSGQLTLARDVTLFNATSGSGQTRFNGKITGTGDVSLAFTGSGTNPGIVIANPTNGANDFVGNVRIGSSVLLQLGVNSTGMTDVIPNASRVIFEAATGTFRLSSASETIAGLQSLVTGGGTVSLNRTTSGGGSVTLFLAQTSTSESLDFGGVIADQAAATESWKLNLTKTGAGVQRLSGVNSTYAGITAFVGGVLEVAKLANGGSNSSIGKSAAAAANLAFNGGTLRYIGAGDTTDRLFTMNGRGFLSADGTGALVFSSTGAIAHNNTGTNRTLTLSGASTADNSFAAQLTDTSGTGIFALDKNGDGTWILSGANTYSGGTTVNAGILRLANLAALGTGVVTVNGGTLDLAGLAVTNTIVLGGGTLINAGSWAGSAQLSGAVTDAYIASLPGSSFTIAAGSTVDLSALTSLGEKTLVYSGGTVTGSGSNLLIEIADGTTLGSAFGGGRALIKTGSNVTLTSAFTRDVRFEGGTLAGLADYAGALTVGGNATLDLDGAGNTAVTTTATINLEAGSTLKGTGTFGGGTISGIHAPGNSPGIQTSEGNLTYTAGSSFEWELAANTDIQGNPAANFDQVIVNGDLNFAGATTLALLFDASGSVVDWSDIFWDEARSWVLYDVSGSVSGISNLSLQLSDWKDIFDVSLSSARAGYTFRLSQSGSDILLNYEAIPEPSTYGLILGGLALAGAAIRRRARRHKLAR